MTASSSNAKNSPYHRFIPREEVQAVSAWEFPSMDGKPSKAQLEATARAQAELEAAPAELPPPDLELMLQQAYDEGFEQGRQAGEKSTREALDAPLRRTAEDAARRLNLLLQNAQGELQHADERLAEQLLHLACDLARQVVRRELDQPQDVLKAVIAEALSQTVDDHRRRIVKLNPMDLALIQNHLGEWTEGGQITFVAHDKLSAGGCVVETATCTVDASVEKRWARAVANLGLQSDWAPAEADEPAGAQADV
ncbi:MAG: flagellar assembly protein FliH [Hydrogenophaga sp.]|nr:flagellar assembly protein FliH [Hydrogenophaga sp.]